MKNDVILFSLDQGNLLIRLLIAHITGQLIINTNNSKPYPKWSSSVFSWNIPIVFLSTYILSGILYISVILAIVNWLIYPIKEKYKTNAISLFPFDQILQLLTLIILWLYHFELFDKLYKAISIPFVNYNFSLILLAYFWVCFPVGYLIKTATQNIQSKSDNKAENNLEKGGKLIGQFERIIILTLVLLKQYEAIGFLITGKSIIRFADNNSNLKSEYVLVGTMMSYAFAIITGVMVNFLLCLSLI